MNTSVSDSWFKRRFMKLTVFEKWSVNNPYHARHTVQTALTLLEYVDLPRQPRCLEIGCGQGALARLLVERYDARMIASDYDPAQVAVARERLADIEGQVEFRVVDGREMPFEDAGFDALFSFGVLHHIPGGWQQVIAEAARVLKPSGWFVFTDFVPPPRAGRWLRRLLPRLDQLEETMLHNCLAENGLHLEHYTYGRAILAGLMRYCIAVARKA
jgi:ubiquinone/menaquinone biosynthesis C-methylase UbiE